MTNAMFRVVVAVFAGALVVLQPVLASAQELPSLGPSPLATSALLALAGLLPFALVITTSFAKFVVVFGLLRNALGAQSIPPAMVVSSLALILTAIVMAPIGEAMMAPDLAIWSLERADLANLGQVLTAVIEAIEPWRSFLAANSGEAELALFARLESVELVDTTLAPLHVVIPAFALTELAEAFTIGFLLFLPFLVVDLVTGSVLLSLGMHMLSPTAVSLPFKLLLFVLVDGWLLLAEGLVSGYTYPPGLGG
jgi:type III secretion protein R